MRIRLVEIRKRGNDSVTFALSPLQIEMFLLLALPKSGSRKPNYDSRPISGQSGALAALLSLRSSAVRAGLRTRRDARRHWLEARQPFRAGRVQDHAYRFFSRPRQALPPEARA